MEFRKALFLIILCLTFTGLVFAYTGSSTDDTSGGGGSGDTGGGDTGGDTDPGGENGGDDGGGSEGQPGTCYDGNDNDQYNGADADDEFSCVQPNGSDHIEGSIWDTDLTTTMDGESPSLSRTPSVFFSGSVEQGNDNDAVSDGDSGSLTEYYVRALQSESDGYYGYGILGSTTYSNFPSGTVFQDGRAVDPPNPDGSQKCGDALENEGVTKTGDVGGETSTNDCIIDYGRVTEKFYIKSPYERDGLDCDQDYAECSVDEESCDTTPASCGGSSCSCPANDGSADATCKTSCEWTQSGDNSDDESNTYYLESGDIITTHSCQDSGGPVDSANCEVTSQECSVSSTSCSYDTTSSCDISTSCTASGASDSAQSYSERGRFREMTQIDSYDCTQHSVTDGGGDDSTTNKPDNDPAGTYTRFTAHKDDTWDTDNGAGVNQDGETQDGTVWCGFDYALTVDADGPRGNGDGFVVIDDGQIKATEAPNGEDTVGKRIWVDGSNSGRDYTNRIDTNCPAGKSTCLKYVDFITSEGSSNPGSPDWTSVDQAVEINDGQTETYTADESYSVCKAINRINEKNGDGTELIDCDYERGSVGSEDISPLPEVGGDEPNEHLIIMEGPEVDNSVTQDYLAFEQKVVDWEDDTGVYGESLDSSACVVKGKVVSEGTVVPIQTYNTVEESFEMGTPSPDWEVCLDLEDGTGDDEPWDNTANDQASQDFGGEWYDLDDERVNDYISGSGNNLISNGDPNDVNDVAFYYRTNPNPQHPDYNPAGGESGLALEDDCDPALDGCDTTGDSIQGAGADLFYGSFEDFTRDEDYHPQFQNANPPYGMNPLLEGHLKKLKEDSNQLEPGMDTEYSINFGSSDSYWVDSRGGEDYADQYGYVDERSDALSNRGNSRNPDTGEDYTPGSTYVRTSSAERDNIGSETVEKTQKVFANSIVVESTSSGPFESGEGYWLDPDDLRIKNNDFNSDWWDLVRFNIDLTGPDSGLGWDDGTDPKTKDYDTKQGSSVVRGGIYWENEDKGGNQYHEKPMCGDDQLEFFIEEMGESANPARTDGRYACVDSKDKCVTFASENRIAETGEYKQAGEPDEDVGRLKNDKEVCLKDKSDEQPKFWDQDYGDVDGDGQQETCKVNNLYSRDGVRWIDQDYVTSYPHAVTGGIDDDWNGYLEQLYNLGRHDRYTSLPNQNSWNFGGESPVPSGAKAVGNDSIATLGFCGGDDEGEFLVTQECNSNLCETNRSVMGVAKNPDSCVIDEETMSYDTSVDERTVFEPGTEIDVNLGSETRQLTCFNNNWFDEYPIIFNQQNVEVPFGESSSVRVHLINVRQESTTFEVEMLDPLTDNPSAYQYSTFIEESGDRFETTVAAESSKTFTINIEGVNKAIGDSSTSSEDELTVRASAVNSEMTGEDSTTVNVVENNATNSSVGRSEPQSVPGIGAIHLIGLMLISSAVFFLQS